MSTQDVTIKLPLPQVKSFIKLLTNMQTNEDIILSAFEFEEEWAYDDYKEVMNDCLPAMLVALYEHVVPELARDIERHLGSKFLSYPDRTIKQALTYLVQKPDLK